MHGKGLDAKERAFFEDFADCERRLACSTATDVRAGVWRRIAREERAGLAHEMEAERRLNRWLTGCDIAAAVAAVAGVGVLYAGLKSVLPEMYWSGSFFSIGLFF